MVDDEFQKLSNDRFDEIMDFEAGQKKLESLKRMRARVNWEIEEERESFYWQLCRLINDWKSRLPNLREIFRREEIDWLLTKCVKIGPTELIKFVIRTGYKDEPDLDDDDKPLLCRNTPVHYAAEHRIRDWMPKVRELFKIYDKFNVNYTNESGFNHFHAACMSGCDVIVEKFLELGQDPNCIVQQTGVSTLHLALRHKRREVVQLLLRSHADPNLANKKGFTPLHIICRGGNDEDLFEEFFKITNEIQQTVQVEARDISGRTPLHWAVHYRHMKLVDLLLRRGADVNSKDAGEHSCLHFIGDIDDAHDVTEKFFEICGKIQLTVQVNALNKLGQAPLHMALSNGKPKMVEGLLRNGADPNIADAGGFTPLHYIAFRGIDDMAEKFFEICNDMQLKVQVNAQENHGRTPLQIAVCYDKEHVVESLLRNGADPNIADVEKCTSLHSICATDYDDDLAEKFLQICDDMQLTMQVDAQSKLGWTPLHLALFKGKKKASEWLLRRGVNPNLANKKGCTPLHAISCREIDDDFAEWFFEICDDMNLMVQVDARNTSGETPLHLALNNGKERNVKDLLRKGSDPNLTSTVGYHPLHIIASRPIDDELVEKFIKMCSDIQLSVQVDFSDKHGRTPLHLALLHGKKQNIKDLLRRGANPNSADACGLLPLHIICNGQHDDDLVKLFFEIADDLQQTVQVDAQDEWGLTPLETAVGCLSPGVVDVLLDHGADLSSFVFPPDDYFCEMFDVYKREWDKLKLTSGILAVAECLNKRGYEMDRSDVLTIIKLFVEYESFEKSSDLLEKFWRNDEEFTSKAIEIIIIPNCLSLFDLLLLQPEEAAKLLTYTNYFEIERLNNLDKIPEQYRDKCLRYLCEKMSRRYFKKVALDAFQELIHYRLPILCSDMVIENLKNEDLFRIYEAGEIVAKENKAKLSDTVDKGPVEQKVQFIKRQRS